ncbi:MAG: radical SAM protein [Deltaproteobacteria bacterium]|nr:radical SAM protein [Deltaproteobacteria bacterium]
MIPIHEILHTIQGEGTRAGRPCVLIRTLGCNLDCTWCDTDQSDARGRDMQVEQIVQSVVRTRCRLVEVTGGEPLLHEETPALCSALQDAGLEVLVETNGSLDVGALPRGVVRIMDIKPPSSGEGGKFLASNVGRLGSGDEVKMVVADRNDYNWARERLTTELAGFEGTCLLSPLTPGMDPGTLARWILEDRLDVRLNLQTHKILFPDGEPRI